MGLWNLIAFIASWLVQFFLGSRLAKFAGALAIATMFIGLVAAFVTAAYTALYSVSVLAPPSVGFGLSFIPSSAPAMIAVYFSVLTMKRILDYKKQLFDWVAEPMLARVEGQLANRSKLPKRR
jgi:hypothetical protein